MNLNEGISNKFEIKNNIKCWIFPKDYNKINFFKKLKFNNEKNLTRRKKEHLLAYFYTKKTMSELYKINSRDLKINFKQGQAPYFEDEKMGYISLSHCKNVIILGWSSEKIGIDIERKNRKTNPIIVSKRFFTKDEFNQIIQNEKLSSENFIKTWVIKESIIKHQKLSKWDDSKKFVWRIGANKVFNSKDNIEIKVKYLFFKKWVIGIACNALKV